MKTTIEYKGQSVDCYGKIDDCKNIAIEGDYNDGSELSVIDVTGYNNWTEAVKAIVDHFDSPIYELSAC